MPIEENVDQVTIIPIRLLPDVAGLDLNHYFPVGKPTGVGNDYSYKVKGTNLATMIGEQIGQVTVPDRKFYRVKDEVDGVNPVTGGDTVTDPSIEGWDYFLDKRGPGAMEKGTDWQNDVPGGGWRLTGGVKFVKGEVYIATPKPAVSNILASADAVARFSNGVRVMNANGPIISNDFRKLIVISGATAISLPLAAQYPKNVVLSLSTVDGPQKQCTINLQGADKVYNSGAGLNKFYMCQWQSVFLVTPDNITWYILPGSDSVFKDPYITVGWSVGINQIAAIGSTQNRADLPGLWDYVVRLKAAKPDAVKSGGAWAANRTYWGEGNGSTTFTVPDLRGENPRYLDMGRGIDTDRIADDTDDVPGSAQGASFPNHYHFAVKDQVLASGSFPYEIGRNVTALRSLILAYQKTSGGGKESYRLAGADADYNQTGVPDIGPTSGPRGTSIFAGTENRGRNTAHIPLINLT